MNAPLPAPRSSVGCRWLGWLLLPLVALGACVATPPVPTPPEVKLVPVFIDPLERCTLMCAPYAVRYSCENADDRECHCADGKTIKANKPETHREVMPSAERQRMRWSSADRLGLSVGKGAASNWPSYSRPPFLEKQLYPLRRPRKARA